MHKESQFLRKFFLWIQSKISFLSDYPDMTNGHDIYVPSETSSFPPPPPSHVGSGGAAFSYEYQGGTLYVPPATTDDFDFATPPPPRPPMPNDGVYGGVSTLPGRPNRPRYSEDEGHLV